MEKYSLLLSFTWTDSLKKFGVWGVFLTSQVSHNTSVKLCFCWSRDDMVCVDVRVSETCNTHWQQRMWQQILSMMTCPVKFGWCESFWHLSPIILSLRCHYNWYLYISSLRLVTHQPLFWKHLLLHCLCFSQCLLLYSVIIYCELI